MNENHAQLCPSPGWASHIQDEVLPYLVNIASLGDYMLELGPGPGAATEWLRHRVAQLVVVDADQVTAERLSERFADTNVEVIHGDGSDIGFAPDTFDSVGSFTMLHHVPTFKGQQLLLQEVFRVLKPGGVFVGSDSLASNDLHHFHEGDDYFPIEPAPFVTRLQSAGFERLTIEIDGNLKFVARKPDLTTSPECEQTWSGS